MDITKEIITFNNKFPHCPIDYLDDSQGGIITISGSLEYDVSFNLQGIFALIIEHMEQGKRIVIDMSKVQYISSTGVGLLTNTLIDVKKKDVGIIFKNASSKITAIFDILGLTKFFSFECNDV